MLFGIGLLAVLLVILILLMHACGSEGSGERETIVRENTTEAETEQTFGEPVVTASATIVSTGDLLMHGQLITDAWIGEDTYDFGYLFTRVKRFVFAADYAVANLETTLSGVAPYQGNPLFNCPDAIVDAAKNAGFDMLLTANNHSYDTGQNGYDRTIRTVRTAGLSSLGTMLSADERKYEIVDINGIKIGMICYTYEDSDGTHPYPSLNYISMSGGSYDIINCFRKNDPEPFYTEIAGYISDMRADGAEAIVVYLHWGEEYQLEPNAQQTAMAQRLCDLGVDVIIGGHPHVVEPLALLTSTQDPEHKTVCLYSMGNAVSNQRQGKISSISTAHTEDGVLFYIGFEKYSDGQVKLRSVDLIPTWVRAIDRNGDTVVNGSGTIVSYEMLPLDEREAASWQQLFGINDSTLVQCQESWQRTMDIVGTGLQTVQDYLAQT